MTIKYNVHPRKYFQKGVQAKHCQNGSLATAGNSFLQYFKKSNKKFVGISISHKKNQCACFKLLFKHSKFCTFYNINQLLSVKQITTQSYYYSSSLFLDHILADVSMEQKFHSNQR